ncbi:MAG: DUF4367 domain-containing protein [Oscillospiraceae bacterium]|jgi:hypothetical protein|nr:DUF4367 domain-containing protein [Oscillospiraceae bacterium]
MRELLKRATTEELNQLMDMTLDAESITNAQVDLLYGIVDELTERGEIEKPPEEEVRAQYAALLSKAEELGIVPSSEPIAESMGGPNEENAKGVIHALLQHGTVEELSHLRSALAASDVPKEEIEELLDVIEAELADKLDATPMPLPRAKPKRKFVRPALVAASVTLAFFLNSIVAYASGFDFFGSLAQWSKDAVYFVFGTPSEDGQDSVLNPEYLGLQATLENVGIRVNLPTYIPNGYRYDTIEPDEPNEFSIIIAWFVRGDGFFSIRIKRIATTASFSEINNEEQSEVYKGHYLITSNVDRTKALWYDGLHEIQIQGNLIYEELTKILDSI